MKRRVSELKKITALCSIILITVLLISLVGCSGQEIKPKNVSMYGYFDTVCTVYDYTGGTTEEFSAVCREIEDMLGYYHKLFDIYNGYEGVVNVYTLNHGGGAPVRVSRDLFEFLEYAKQMYTLTNGEMNVAMGTVLQIWHEKRKEGLSLPDRAELSKAAEHTDITKVKLDEENLTVTIEDPELRFDVGALGKGFAAAKIAEKLKSEGKTSYVLDFGGNLTAIGTKKDGTGWKTGVKNPTPQTSKDTYSTLFTLSDASVSTSGDYERYYTVDGVRYHHIIDRDTLFPARNFSSVTVVAADPALSDALSTALFCMSYDEGRNLVSTLDGVDAYWIMSDGSVRKTAFFEED